MTLKEKIQTFLLFSGIITLIFWVILGVLYIFGFNEVSWYDFVQTAYVVFGWGFVVIFLIDPNIIWIIKKINKMK